MKADADQFKRVLNEIPKQARLDPGRSRWLRFSFHFTDILNAVEILKADKIRCRADLEAANALTVDIASPSVIAKTGPEVKDSVRLYFRPRTPTQYRMEGFRPKAELWEGCHCPVPIFFLFDSFTILTRDDSSFSDSNLAKLGFHQLCTTADELETFDFQKIFHVTWLSAEEKQDIISRRNAEIIIPTELDLSSLRYIYCRTPAEKETLLYLLPDNILERWGSMIRVEVGSALFFREWAFVETVSLNENSTTFTFSPDAKVAGPFKLVVKCSGDKILSYERENFFAAGKFTIKFREDVWHYEIAVYLDGHIAYAGNYDGTDAIPF